MDAKQLRILFMGTPRFAVASLKRLVEEGYNVVAIVTAPDRPAGRGQKLQQSDVKRYAAEVGIPVLQPEKLRDPDFLEELRSLDIDLGIVIAFKMLPQVVWAMPRLGTFNLHASLLPQYRGAAPINRAIINGETITGNTTFMLNEEIDKGDIIARSEMQILPQESAGSLHDRLMQSGTSLVIESVNIIASGEISPLSQENIPEEALKTAPKIFKTDCRIEWTKSGREIADLIRGLSPYPTAWSGMRDEKSGEVTDFKIFDGRFFPTSHGVDPGTVDLSDKGILKIASPDGWIAVTDLQPSGRRRMSSAELLNGIDKTGRYKFY